MNRFIRALMALALSCLLGVGPAIAGPFASYPAAPAPNGTALGLAWQGGPTVVTTSNAWNRANLGSAKVTTLEAIALIHSLPYLSADDHLLIAEANSEITAAASTGGLTVNTPPNVLIKTSVGPRLDNHGGYNCPGFGTSGFQQVRSTSDATNNWFVTVNNSWATSPVFMGCAVFGGTTAYSSAFPSAWLDNQNGVNFTFAYNGSNDPTYVSNSTIGAQEPNASIGNLLIGGFGGTCLNTQGAGASIYYNITIQGCGANGWINNQYDSKFYGFDVGATGLSAFICGAVGCGSDEIWIKTWYPGGRGISDKTHGAEIYGGANTIILNSQDSGGSSIVVDNTSNNIITAKCQWQGQINSMDPAVACVSLRGTDHNLITINASQGQLGSYGLQLFPAATTLIEDRRSAFQPYNLSYSTYNDIRIVANNFPNDNYVCNTAWFTGPLDTTNTLTCNGSVRQARTTLPDPSTGNLNVGATMNGSVVGMIAEGASGFYPGSVSIVAQRGGGALVSYIDTSTVATGTLTASSNPSDGDVVTIGGKTWTFRSTLTPYSSFNGSISGNVLTVNYMNTAQPLHVHDVITGLAAPNTYIIAQTSGTTGGAGTYTVSVGSQTVPPTSTGLSNVNMIGGTNQVHIGSTAAKSIANLHWAINALSPSFFVGYISGTTLTTTIPQNGLLHVGDSVLGLFVTSTGASAPTSAGTVVTAISSGNQGLTGTFTLNNSQTVGSNSYPVQFNGVAGTIGTDYGYGTVASLDVTANDNGAGVLTVTAQNRGVAGNALASTTTSSALSWSASTLSGGTAGAQTYKQVLYWDGNAGFYFPTIIAKTPLANNAAACAAGYLNGQIWRDNADTGGALHIASC